MFDSEFSKQDLSTLGNPFEKISLVMSFEMLREMVELCLIKNSQKIKTKVKSRICIWFYGTQKHAWFICSKYRNSKSQWHNRFNTFNVQYF